MESPRRYRKSNWFIYPKSNLSQSSRLVNAGRLCIFYKSLFEGWGNALWVSSHGNPHINTRPTGGFIILLFLLFLTGLWVRLWS